MKFSKIWNRINKPKCKIILWCVFVFIIFGWGVFAQSNISDTSWLGMLGQVLNFIVWILSWLWVVLSVWAGKLMSNSFVYWEFINLDEILRQWRNIMKNFANFALWFMVIFYIFKGMFSQEWVAAWFKDKIVKILIAVVSIQASWFLFAAVVDVSTILTASISSLSSQVIYWDNDLQNQYKSTLSNVMNVKYTVKYDPNKNTNPWSDFEQSNLNPQESQELMDSLLPSSDNLSGPFLFMWLSIFEFQNFTNPWADLELWKANWEDVLSSVTLNLVLILFFSVMMALLFIFNLFRVLVLRVIIPFMPIIILLWAFDKDMAEKLWWITDLKNILLLIFKPVFYVLFMSIAMIVLILTHQMLSDRNYTRTLNNMETVKVTNVAAQGQEEASSTMEVENLFRFTLNSAKHWLWSLFVFALSLAILWMLVKLAVSQWTGIKMIDNSMNKIWDTANKGLWAIPVLPVPGGKVWITAMQNVINKDPKAYQTFMDKRSQDSQELRKFLGIDDDLEKRLEELAGRWSSNFWAIFKEYIEEKDSKTVGTLSNYRKYLVPYLNKKNNLGLDLDEKSLHKYLISPNANLKNISKDLWFKVYKDKDSGKVLFDTRKKVGSDNSSNTWKGSGNSNNGGTGS